jgi:hypothetical protein
MELSQTDTQVGRQLNRKGKKEDMRCWVPWQSYSLTVALHGPLVVMTVSFPRKV